MSPGCNKGMSVNVQRKHVADGETFANQCGIKGLIHFGMWCNRKVFV